MKSFKSVLPTIALLLWAACAQAQSTTAVISYESTDARQFGYRAWDKGLAISVTHRFGERWEGAIAGEVSDAQKSYVGNGRHLAGALGARYYLRDDIFLTAGASVGGDINSDYTKIATRGYLGAGIKVAGMVATLTAFAPPNNLTVDLNQVKGFTLLVEYFRPIAGPLGIYSAGQASLASFNQTGNPNARFTGASWKARAGVYLAF